MHNTEPRLRIGSDQTYARVWDWGLRGANREIGHALASYGRDELGVAPLACPDTNRIRAQQRFFEAQFRPFRERMAGVAEAFDCLPSESARDFSTLWFDVEMPGCSAGFVPDARMENGHSHVLRNMDLGADLTGTSEHPASSRILTVDMDPDEGYASLSVVVFDLMSAMDGINEKGLVVVCNSHGDYRLTGEFRPTPPYLCEPVCHPEPGLNELQVVRYLLDMCADIDEAKEAFLSLRTYYCFTPCLYLIADVRGRAIVVEKSPSGNLVTFTERDGEPLVVTNFALSRFAEGEELPNGDAREQGFIYARHRAVTRGVEAAASMSTSQLTSIARDASFDQLCGPRPKDDLHPDRTIYTCLYDIDARTVTLSCYLGEVDGGTSHSDPVTFALGGVLDAA